jgi:hypothetical protein
MIAERVRTGLPGFPLPVSLSDKPVNRGGLPRGSWGTPTDRLNARLSGA